jgi:predicted transcriptional regulator
MKIIGTYLNGAMDWDKYSIEMNEYGRVEGRYRKDGDIAQEIKIPSFRLIRPRKDTSLPFITVLIALTKVLEEIDIEKIKILEKNYEEQEFKVNPMTGQEEQLTPVQIKKQIAEQGGRSNKNGNGR